ncbi:MAG: riboflavin biosynthesis protein RibD [Thiotrichales bacterium]|nr:MAG: riboflavin biosynthesis protein RibD [Thiotrichales bacterium]
MAYKHTVQQHIHFMQEALNLAKQGLYSTKQNPRVGCVIVKNHTIIGKGFHLRPGEDHAEVVAIRDASSNGHDISNATFYITLEPCHHIGRTPACINAVLNANPKEVIIGVIDPNLLTCGKSIAILKDRGIKTVVGVLEEEIKRLNKGFFHYMQTGLPYVTCKIAMSLDGKIAMTSGESKWITSESARQDSQNLRASSCAVMSGVGTIVADNPRLNVRLKDFPQQDQPMIVVLDSNLRTPVNSNIFHTGNKVILLTLESSKQNRNVAKLQQQGAEIMFLPSAENILNLNEVMQVLAKLNVTEILVEAGSTLNTALLDANLVNEIVFYIAPKILGNHTQAAFNLNHVMNLNQAREFEILSCHKIDKDLRITALVK